jgi:2-dehydro-3-deoxyphosphogalactonate aldolase
MSADEKFAAAWARLPLVAVLRGLRPDEAPAIGAALVQSGWGLIEVPLNSPQPLRSIEALAKMLPDALVGAGTVLDAQQVRDVHAGGGQLIVAPNFDLEVVREARRLGMACLPGVLTASEAFAALRAGATGLKLFPAEMIPPAAVKALRAVLPQGALLLPVGGIAIGNMDAYRSVGADGFGIGSSLYKPGMSASELEQKALDFAAAWAHTIRA